MQVGDTVLPGIIPTASIRLDVLIEPDREVVSIQLEARAPDGTLLALRSFPISRINPPADRLLQAFTDLVALVETHVEHFYE